MIESAVTAKQEITVGTPSYQVVIDHINAGIAAGVYPPGSKLPTIAALADLTGVSQTSVKTALLLLNQQGVVRGQQGKGTFVTDPDRSSG